MTGQIPIIMRNNAQDGYNCGHWRGPEFFWEERQKQSEREREREIETERERERETRGDRGHEECSEARGSNCGTLFVSI